MSSGGAGPAGVDRVLPGTVTAPVRLSRAQARRIALAAQGFGERRPPEGSATMRHLQRVIDTVAVVQIDSVNVVTRSQYLPFFSRLGRYDQGLLDRARDQAPRRLVEYWAHEASLVAPPIWPLLDFRMRRADELSWGGMQSVARDHPDVVAAVLDEVALRGPITSRGVEVALAHDQPRGSDEWGWNWSVVKRALEHLFWAGQISSAGRTASFERRYAALERVLPPAVRPFALRPQDRPSEPEAFKQLIMIAARAHGVGSEQCLRDYFRLKPEQARPALAALVAEGSLVPATIEGWKRPAYLHPQARRPRRIAAQALLSPFDSLIWQRDRTSALFGFDYRLEIYVPVAQRVHGYYVLPFLFGESLVARCDLKADRAAGVLRVHAVHWEPDAPGGARAALGEELALMARWLGLASVAEPG